MKNHLITGSAAAITAELTNRAAAKPVGATKKQSQVVTYLLHETAKLILAKTQPGGTNGKVLLKAAEESRKALIASHKPDELKPIFQMRDTITGLISKLVNANDVDTLVAYEHYLSALLRNEVLVVEDVPNPEAYGLKPNI